MTTLAHNVTTEQDQAGRTGSLMPREALFVSYYLQSLNGTQAAKRAGYVGNVPMHAVRLMREPRIKSAIEKGYRELAPSPHEVLARITAQARATIADVFDIDDRGYPVLNLKKAEEAGKLGLIRSLKWDNENRPVVEMCDSQAALLHLAKILGLLVDRHVLTGPNDGPIQVAEVRASVELLLTNPETMTQAMDLAEKLTIGVTQKVDEIQVDGTSRPALPG